MDKHLSSLLRHLYKNNTEQPNLDFLAHKELLTRVGKAQLFPADTNDIIIERIMHALSDPALGALYFGELRSDPALQQKVLSAKSNKKAYDQSVFEQMLADRKETLFEMKKNDFWKFVHEGADALTHKLTAKQEHKTQLTKQQSTQNRQESQQITKDIDQKINTFKSMLKKIPNNHDNKQAIANYTTKIKTLQAEKQQLLSETLINTSGGKSTIESISADIKTIESTRKDYQAIYSGKCSSGALYTQLKEMFIKSHIAPLAYKDVQGHMFTQEEAVFQKNLVDWLCQEIQKRKLDGPGKNDPKSIAYLNEIASARQFFLDECEIKEHLFNILIELIQMNFLESCLKKTMKQKFQLYKAPFIDDIRSNTDCILRVYPKNDTNDYIILIDLKNMYWRDEDMRVINQESNTKEAVHIKNQHGSILQETAKRTPYATEHILQIQSKTAPTQPSIMKVSPSITRSLLLSYLEELKTNNHVKNTTYVNHFLFHAVHNLCSKEQKGYIQEKITPHDHTLVFMQALNQFIKKTGA